MGAGRSEGQNQKTGGNLEHVHGVFSPFVTDTEETQHAARTLQSCLAYAYRFGHGAVTKPDSANCAFCSYAGEDDYSIHLSGIYLDASYKF